MSYQWNLPKNIEFSDEQDEHIKWFEKVSKTHAEIDYELYARPKLDRRPYYRPPAYNRQRYLELYKHTTIPPHIIELIITYCGRDGWVSVMDKLYKVRFQTDMFCIPKTKEVSS